MRFVALILIVSAFTACKKAEDRRCMKAVGDNVTLELALPEFDKLRVGPKMEVVLVQDTVNKMIVNGGENLINFITAEMNNEGYLLLKNSNKCDFLRSYKKSLIKVELHFKEIRNLFFEGTHDITTLGAITTNTFSLEIQDSGATAYLNLNCTKVTASQGHGYGNFVLSGNCDEAIIKVISNGFGDTRSLHVANKLVVVSDTPVNTSVNAQGAASTFEINGTGDIIYYGTPSTLSVIQYGKGNVVKAE